MTDRARPLGLQGAARVAVVRALHGIGDLLCTVPALRALRAALPRAHVTLIGLPTGRPFVARFSHYVDEFLEFPGYPGIPEVPVDPGRVARFLHEAQRRTFDLALQLHGSGATSNAFAVLLGARRTAGFYLPGSYCPDEDLFLAYPSDEPEIRRHLALIRFLGFESEGEHLEWRVTDEDARALDELGVGELERHGYVCVHPGARERLRRWPPERFAEVADLLASHGLRVVLTGSAEEAPCVEAVGERMTHEYIDLAGRTNLGAFGALLSRARLLVSNDTGPSHLAAALAVPSVVVFTGSDPARWAPLDRKRHRAIGHGMREPHPCGSLLRGADLCLRDGCTLPSRRGLKTFDSPPVEDVLAEVEELLDQEKLNVG